MKKNHFFRFVGALAIALGVASCTSDDENHSPDQVEPKINTTRSVSEMTNEEVQARIDEIEKEYGVVLYVNDTAKMTETDFLKIEKRIISTKEEWRKKAENNGI